jgi:hypothetical protein
LWQQAKAFPSQGIVMRGHFLQTDAHIQQVLLMHLKVLYHEKRRHTRVTS